MGALGMDADVILQIQKILSAVLLLGNVVLDESNGLCTVRVNAEAEAVAVLLNCDQAELLDSMCHKRLPTKDGSSVRVGALSRREVQACRDALATALYEGLFGSVVKMINAGLSSNRNPSSVIHVSPPSSLPPSSPSLPPSLAAKRCRWHADLTEAF